MGCPIKPPSRPENASVFQRIQLFRSDLFASQPERLYRAWMAEQRAPFYRSYLVNQPDLVSEILSAKAERFPKARIVGDTVGRALGQSIFTSNGAEWRDAKTLIDPAFLGAGQESYFAAILGAANAMVERLQPGEIDLQPECSFAAADAIMRALFSTGMAEENAQALFDAFQRYQQAQPFWSPAALLRLPRWLRPPPRRTVRGAAGEIRALVAGMIDERMAAIAVETAPDDIATRMIAARDASGRGFDRAELIDQITIFLLAGHESSAAALGWALYLLAFDEAVQTRAREQALTLPVAPTLSDIRSASYLRDVFREALRLYPPVPMILREAANAEHFRDRDIAAGSMVIVSPWHLHRHSRIWANPDDFDPDRWQSGDTNRCPKQAFIPFSTGPRGCIGQSFAMIEGITMLASLLRRFEFSQIAGQAPEPVAYLTVRSRNGIRLKIRRCSDSD